MTNLQRIHVVINPAAGGDQPILAALHHAWPRERVNWSVSITQQDGDGAAQARYAVDRGCEVIAVAGGDGTVAEVATAMAETDVPMAIVPAGTGNAVAQELGIPVDPQQAAELVVSDRAEARKVDVLRVDKRCSLLRIGVGLDARTMASATRELKDRFGWLAYPIAALGELGDADRSTFALDLDGVSLEVDALAVLVANVGRLGRAGARFPGDVTPFDGLGDVFIVRSLDLGSIATIGAQLLNLGGGASHASRDDVNEPLWHRRARRIRVETHGKSVPFHADGDVRGNTPVEIETLPGGLTMMLPRDVEQDS